MFKEWRQLIFFIKLFGPHLKWMTSGTGLGLVAMISSVGLLALSGWFISAAAYAGLTLATAQLFNFFHPSIGVRLFAIGRSLARYSERVVTHDVTFRILQSLRGWFYFRLEPLAPSRLMRYRSGDILNRIVSDINALDNLYLRVLSPGVVALVMSILVVLFLGLFDPFIAMSTAIFLISAGFGVPTVAMHLGRSPGQEITRLVSDLRIRIVDALQGLPEILVFGADQQQIESVNNCSLALLKCQMRMSHIRGASTALITILSGLSMLFALVLAVDLVNRQMLNGANLALVILAVAASFEAILPLPLAFQYLGQTREAGRRLLEIVETDPEVIFPDHSTSVAGKCGISFEKVNFRYHDQAPWALTDIDIRIPAGGRIAVIGETGSGKSTLTYLAARFWNPVSGHIRLGRKNISSYSEPDLRRLISTVSQQPHMFNGTLKDNLLMASPGSSEKEMLSALQTAQLLEFVTKLPDGLNTWIGESGQMVSGGQVRRIAMARAILHNAPLWVLDEPTEGLDPITEKQMMRALKQHTEGKTLILITHRLVDLEWMDQIVMLDRGRVVDRGSHAELLRNNRRYAELHMRVTN